LEKSKAYLLAQGGLMFLALVSLSALGERRLEVYFSIYTVIHFACSALYRPRRRWLDVPGGLMFAGFCVIVMRKVLEIIG